MKVLLKIGHYTFVLPNDNGLQTVIKTLSQACPANDYSYESRNPRVLVEPDPIEVSVKFLGPKIRLIPVKDRFEEVREAQSPLALEAPTSIILEP